MSRRTPFLCLLVCLMIGAYVYRDVLGKLPQTMEDIIFSDDDDEDDS